jgi:hypothetical protein
MSCNCIQVNATPAATGIEETIQVDGVIVEGFNTYTFTAGGQEYTILWDGELWSLFAVVPGADIFVGSNTNIDCPIGEWTLDPDLGPYYFNAFSTVACGTLSEEENCFKLIVWQKQCTFAKEVLNYIRLIQFGGTCCDALEELKNKRRALLILNCYDVRDINGDTTEYNNLTYSQIKELLNY